jgi:hypothetical protein
MAKNKVYIDVVVDDKGTTKRVAVDAKKLGNALDDAGASQNKYQKQQKGVAGATSNTTKAFSKMTTGISSGLVPAYAVLAANVFAVTAAFNFLKNAGDLVALQAGQVAYASATGTALRSLAKDVIAATDAQISFEDASQASAIGTAAGLSSDQIIRLGKAAKDTSLILGRDVTDSFNRLVRGVTKAEPELLDELGVILRLNDATAEYARITGKSAQNLTPFERSQAVVNDVLDQTERKYSKIIDIVNPTANTFNQLAKTFDTLFVSIRTGVAEALTPLANAINEFPALGVALLAVFGKGVLSAMIPNLKNIGTAAKESADKAKAGYNEAKASLKSYTSELRLADKSAAAARLTAAGVKDPGFTGTGFQMLRAGKGDQLSSQQLVGMKSAIERTKKLTTEQKQHWIRNLDEMLLGTKKSTAGIKIEFEKTGLTMKKVGAGIKVSWTATMAAVKTAAASAAAFAATALSVISWVSLVATLGVVIYDFLRVKEEVDENAKALDVLGDKLEDLNNEYEKFNEVQKILIKEGGSSIDYFTVLGNRISALSVTSQDLLLEDSFKSWSSSIEEASKTLDNMTEAEIKNNQAVNEFIKPIEKATEKTGFFSKMLESFIDVEVSAMQAVATTASTVEEYNEAIEKTTQSFGEFLATSDDKRLQNLSEYYSGLQKEIENLNSLSEGQNTVFIKYLENLNTFLNSTDPEKIKEAKEELLGQAVAVAESTTNMKAYTKAVEDNQRAFGTILNSQINMSQEQQLLNNMTLERVSLLKMTVEQEGKLTEAQQARLNQLNRQHELLLQIVTLTEVQNTREHALAMITETRLRGQTKGQQELIKQELQALKFTNDRLRIEEQIAFQRDILEDAGQSDSHSAANQNIRNLLRELELLAEKEESLKRTRDLNMQVFDAANQALESGLQTGIAALIKGEESSIKDAMLGIAKGMLNAVADTMAKQLTQKIMGIGPLQTAAKQSKIIGRGIIEATQSGAQILGNGIRAAIGTPGMSGGTLGVGGTDPLSAVTSTIGIPYGGTEGTGVLGGLSKAFNFAKSIFGFANGGIAMGGITPYATGGVVKRPTLGLVGEGRYNEAVVPLPDGKAIPVNMSGAGQNNVVVNVSIDNQGNASSNSEQSSQDAGNIGNMIARAVQKELQNQKRSGGILNPYGVA